MKHWMVHGMFCRVASDTSFIISDEVNSSNWSLRASTIKNSTLFWHVFLLFLIRRSDATAKTSTAKVIHLPQITLVEGVCNPDSCGISIYTHGTSQIGIRRINLRVLGLYRFTRGSHSEQHMVPTAPAHFYYRTHIGN